MILSGQSIQKLLDSGELGIKPKPIIKEASVKIHLSSEFSELDGKFVKKKKYKLHPKEFILAHTKESFIIPANIAGFYDGYTHLSRRGVITHLGSMFVDPGTEGVITLEIFNASDNEVLLEPNMRVGHMIFLEVK